MDDADLFVMVRGSSRIWLLVGYTDNALQLETPGRSMALEAPKLICRVGTAKNWRGSTSFSKAWHEGGGEHFK